MTGDAKSPSVWRYAKAVSHVTKFLSNKDATHFILSAEAFCFARDPTEMKKIERIFSSPDVEVLPVVCFRNDEAWRESWFGEIDRWQPKTHRAHGEGMGDIRGDWYFDKSAVLCFWQQIGDVRTVDFDEAVRKHGTILPSLLEAMEIRDIGDTEKYFLNSRG
jgi:hypothetical protein